jgi:hypothetical protein
MPSPNRPIPTVLLVDMLGVRAEWNEHGARGAVRSFQVLEQIVQRVVLGDPDRILDAQIESDCVVVTCRTASNAIRFGQALFLQAFLGQSPSAERQRRVWLRGVILRRPPYVRGDSFRSVRVVSDKLRVFDYESTFLEAVSIEKSGYRGMRLLADKRILTTARCHVPPSSPWFRGRPVDGDIRPRDRSTAS